MAETIETTLYKGSVKIKFYPDSHRYYVNGKPQTGVTTYLGIKDKSRALVIWATELYRDFLLDQVENGISVEHIYAGCGLHEERKKEAANIGTEVHDWVEKFIKGEQPDMPESREAQIGVNAFLDWVDANKVKFLSSERVVYSKKHGFIGKMDIEAKVNGKLCLLDIKTSNGIYNDYALQTAAYVKADEEESGRKYAGRWLIRVAKETEHDYQSRMRRKNENRARAGKSQIVVEPYQVFEAKFLDADASHLDRDFKAFLAAKALYEWNKETDVWVNKAA
jgi:hypothetical protein